MTAAAAAALSELARLYGVQQEYVNAAGRRHRARPEPLLAVLQALGAPLAGWQDLSSALRERRQALGRRLSPPVAVFWGGSGQAIQPAVLLRLPVATAEDTAHCRLREEGGAEHFWSVRLDACPAVAAATVEGTGFLSRSLPVPADLAVGYHWLTVTVAGADGTTLLIVAPRSAYRPPRAARRTWGVFLPLYALHSEASWGVGDLADLAELVALTQESGGGLVGTLPLVAGFMGDVLHDPSPYAPVSRLFWNELYLNVTGLPELAQCPAAAALVDTPGFRAEIAALQSAPLVDYRRALAAKRRVLELLSDCLVADESERRQGYAAWVRAHPAARDYARFRAVTERLQIGWHGWPERLRAGNLEEGDWDPRAEQYHLYAQWTMAEQMDKVAGYARQGGRPGLYLDLPLGVHRDGYDTWRERTAFALAASGGAAPDPGYPEGQDWGFPPLHPEGLREQGYRYFIAGLRQQFPHAGVMRIDHVMGLHRLFWIPRGFSARDGVYVRYPATELYAILALESSRHGTLLVGEDLGTVPRQVRAAMRRHRVQRMYVLPFELTGRADTGLNPAPSGALAALNTHDLPPFAAFWSGEERREAPGGSGPSAGGLGPGDDAGARAALAEYLRRRGEMPEVGSKLDLPPDPAPDLDTACVLQACLRHLAAGPAGVVLVNLEDLWLESAPQNVPNSGPDRPNWRRKARYGLSAIRRLPAAQRLLREVSNLRR